jgi:excisionase family DNA binding protein
MTQLNADISADGLDVPPSFFTAVEVARLFRLDESTLYRHLRAGTFPGLKIGGRYVVPRAVVDRLVADILHTGRCVDLGSWTERWRERSTKPADLTWPAERDGDE